MQKHVRTFFILTVFVVFALVPVFADLFDEPFYLTLFGRIMIFAIAAVSLDLILGYGGMVSFGHAAYLGIGGYSVAILSFYEIDNGFLQLVVAIVGSAVVAFFIGLICLRTSGLYFIMITLALTQMLYFLGISLETYGGDDGINTNRSEFFEWLDINDDTTLYYLIFFFLALCAYIANRIVNSRFGMVVRGSKSNEPRMQAIGFPVFRYKLAAFVIAGTMCGVAGFLLANLSEFVTPEYMHWFRSGEIMIMVLMGGMGTLFGPLVGAAAYLLIEEILSGWTIHWMIIFGPLLLLLVIFFKRGLWGLVPNGRRADG